MLLLIYFKLMSVFLLSCNSCLSVKHFGQHLLFLNVLYKYTDLTKMHMLWCGRILKQLKNTEKHTEKNKNM